MIHTRLINSSVCLKQPRRLSAKRNRRSRRSSAGWSKSRNRKTRSSRITKSVMDVPPTPVCYWLKSIEVHQQQFGHAPRLIAADAAFNWTKDRRSLSYHLKTGQRLSLQNRPMADVRGTRFSTPSPPDQASAFLGFLTLKFPDS